MSLFDKMTVEVPDVAVEEMSEDEQHNSHLADFDADRQSTIAEEDGDDDNDNQNFETTSMVIMSDDAGQVYAPPARIAARFYRDPLSRQYKSSAASSRRNSLSSIQSHTSTRSLRRTSSCQSNYIAQHLRRSSIIEARKARLADRAAHAEKVRLRAAMAKAAPRGDASASEERALAAQMAREKYLAKVAAACAEEVSKAKQKANEIKAKKLLDEKKARLDMEERMADAERRRAEYKRNLASRKTRRASSLEKNLADVNEDTDDAAVPVLNLRAAATRIQRMWRVRQRKLAVNAYSHLHLTLHGIQDRSFEDIGALLSNTTTIQTTSRILRLFALQDNDDIPAAQATRTFLSSYLVTVHPALVFSKNGAQEQHLVTKARELVILFESVMSKLSPWNSYTPSTAMLQDLSQAYTTYISAFDAWRAQDSSALVETMVASFVELDAIWQTVKDDTNGAVAEDYRSGIRDNQVMLLSKIRKLAGPDRADLLIKKAIRESRRRRVKRRTPAEVRPRAAADVDDVDGTDSSDTLPVVAAESLQQPTPNQAGSRDNVRLNLARLFSPIPSNRILTHELALDKDFRLSPGVHSDIRDAVNRELCNGMREGVESGTGSLWTVAMAQEIKAKLVHIVKPGNSMHDFIVEALDTDLIYRQCEQGIFSYASFFSFMANILPKLCAPFRDAQVKVLAEDLGSNDVEDMNAMIEKLFRLLHFIDLLSLDYSNFLLMNAAPVLIRESAGYESRMFAADLSSGSITLSGTIRWWQNASVNILTEADRRDPEQVRHPADRPTSHQIYTRGLVDIVFSQGTPTSDFPETLALDRERLQAIKQKALHMTTIGAILLVAKSMLKRDVRSPWKAEAARLWELLSKEPPSASSSKDSLANLSSRALSVLENAHNLPPSTKSALQSATTRALTQASTQRFTDPVAKVLYSRLRSHVFLRVVAKTSGERVRAASGASEALATAGLPEFVTHVGEIVDMLRRVAEVDWAAHGGWYERVASGDVDVVVAGGV
jgi:hypothetical protein